MQLTISKVKGYRTACSMILLQLSDLLFSFHIGTKYLVIVIVNLDLPTTNSSQKCASICSFMVTTIWLMQVKCEAIYKNSALLPFRAVVLEWITRKLFFTNILTTQLHRFWFWCSVMLLEMNGQLNPNNLISSAQIMPCLVAKFWSPPCRKIWMMPFISLYVLELEPRSLNHPLTR